MKTVALQTVAALLVLMGSTAGRAEVIELFDLPGLGLDIPVDSFTWSLNGINTSAYAGGSEQQTAQVLDFSLRTEDSHSPQFVNAVLIGSVFPTATLRVYKTSISSSIPYISFDFENLLADSYSLAGTWDGSRLAERVSFTYESVTAHYTAGVPGEKPHPWGPFMPPAWPAIRNADDTVDLAFLLSADGPQLPIGAAPDFPFTPDQLRVSSPDDQNFLYTAAALDGTVSPLGEVLPPTLPVAEPSSIALLGVGIGVLAGATRRQLAACRR